MLVILHGLEREAPFSWSDVPKLLTLAGWKAVASFSSLVALVVLVASTVLRFVAITAAEEAKADFWSPVTVWLRLVGAPTEAPRRARHRCH